MRTRFSYLMPSAVLQRAWMRTIMGNPWWAARQAVVYGAGGFPNPRVIEPEGNVGTTLAARVAAALEAGVVLAHSHRDYCGTGLRFADGEYIYGKVFDGRLPTSSEALPWLEASDIERMVFRRRKEFVSCLAALTDQSLSGMNLPESWHHNNGRLTIERLRKFVEECEKNENRARFAPHFEPT